VTVTFTPLAATKSDSHPKSHRSLNINIAQAMIKAPIERMYTHKGSFPAGTSGRPVVFFAADFPGGAE